MGTEATDLLYPHISTVDFQLITSTEELIVGRISCIVLRQHVAMVTAN